MKKSNGLYTSSRMWGCGLFGARFFVALKFHKAGTEKGTEFAKASNC
ncbi:hypothetical protein lacNasYZ02_16560 [Lactobacillus nasalidis]|nr:hypothetical protein lacNasYZ02_16560 [Lactobacillus nasalidis]